MKLKEEVHELKRLEDKYISDVKMLNDAEKKLKDSNEIYMSNINLLESIITGIEANNTANIPSRMKLEQAAVLYSSI